MMTYAKLIGCGCVALLALGCGSKGDGEDDDGDETGGTSSGGTSSGGTSTGGSGGGGPLPVMTTYDFSEAGQVCANPMDANATGCWRFVFTQGGTPTDGPNAGMTADAVPAEDIMVEHTADEGDPAGALQATIPYTMFSQYVTLGINLPSTDLTRRVISARVNLASGLGSMEELAMAPGGSKIYAKSGDAYCYANGAYTNQGDAMHPAGMWNTIQFTFLRAPDFEASDCASPFDPSDVREIGIQFDSSGSAVAAETAVWLIDNVTF